MDRIRAQLNGLLSREHRRSLGAFLLVGSLMVLVIVTGLRSEAAQGLLDRFWGRQDLAAGHVLTPTPPVSSHVPSQAPTSGEPSVVAAPTPSRAADQEERTPRSRQARAGLQGAAVADSVLPAAPDSEDDGDRQGSSGQAKRHEKGKAKGHEKGKAKGHEKGKAKGHGKGKAKGR